MGAGSGGNFGNTKGSGKIHGFPKIIHSGKQGKHIPSHNNYQKGKSIFYGSEKKAQELVINLIRLSEYCLVHRFVFIQSD